jgi:uncharacterized protein (DUF305 family)
MIRLKSLLMLTVLCFAASCSTQRPAANSPAAEHPNMDHNSAAVSMPGHSMMESSPGAAEAPYDLQFLDTMIAHHQGAIDMAQLVETRAQHTELKSLAKSIIEDQQKEIAQMKKWRDEWFAGKPAAVNMAFPGMHQGMSGMDMEKLDDLKENGFDLEFIKQMIPHHQGALVMAEDAAGKAQHPEIKGLADQITAAQQAEIKQMSEWEKVWSKNP